MRKILRSSINRMGVSFFLGILLTLTTLGTITSGGQEAKTDHSFVLNTFYPDLSFIRISEEVAKIILKILLLRVMIVIM